MWELCESKRNCVLRVVKENVKSCKKNNVADCVRNPV